MPKISIVTNTITGCTGEVTYMTDKVANTNNITVKRTDGMIKVAFLSSEDNGLYVRSKPSHAVRSRTKDTPITATD
jgi:hypothetical protein